MTYIFKSDLDNSRNPSWIGNNGWISLELLAQKSVNFHYSLWIRKDNIIRSSMSDIIIKDRVWWYNVLLLPHPMELMQEIQQSHKLPSFFDCSIDSISHSSGCIDSCVTEAICLIKFVTLYLLFTTLSFLSDLWWNFNVVCLLT